LIPGKSSGDSSVKEKSAKGDYKRLEFHLGYKNPVKESDSEGKTENGDEGGWNRPTLLGQQPRQAAPHKADYGTDGKIDTSGYDDEGNADTDYAKKSRAT